MDVALKKLAVPVLRSQGFKGSYPHFRRFAEDHFEVLGFQFSNWGPQFYIEIGVCGLDGVTLLDGRHFPARNIKYYKCERRIRIGDSPFDFESAEPDLVGERAAIILREMDDSWKKVLDLWRSVY